MTERATRPLGLVCRGLADSQPFPVFLHNVPDSFPRNPNPPNTTLAANASEYPAMRYLRHSLPIVDRLLHPSRHWNCTNVPAFPDKVNNGPVVFSALNVVKAQVNKLSSTEPTPQENR